MFVKDPASKTKEMLTANNITLVNKVVDLGKLRKKYSRYEDRRKLVNSYDIFLADKTIVPSLPSALGKAFLQKKRYPIPLAIEKGNVLEKVKNILGSTMFYMGSGVNSSVKIGYSNSTSQQLIDNITTVTDNVISYLPDQWNSIHSIYLKTSTSLPIPLYVVLPVPQVKIQPTTTTPIEDVVQEDNTVTTTLPDVDAKNTTNEVAEEPKKRSRRYMDAKKSPSKRVKSVKPKQ
jgi:ribosome biogenesis protein UTP30